MTTPDVVTRARDVMVARTVFGEPVVQDGVTVVPAARVRGGAGGGSGPEQGDNGGSGGGFGVMAAPAGAFVIRNGEVSWRPAVDVNRIVLGGQLVAIAALLTIRAIAKRRGR